jgi:hypothetical protein
MYSCDDTRCRVGCPIRISTDQRLLAAPRGFSQRATSFIASWCQGIHRMPFLYSIARTRSRGSVPHHAQKPSSETPEDDPGNLRVFRTQHDPPRPVSPRSLARSWITGSDRIVHNASEPSPSDRWGTPPCGRFPGQTHDRTTGALTNPKTDRCSHAPRDAPEPDSH